MALCLSFFQKPSTEDSKCSPWTNLAKHKLLVENKLKDIPGLNYIIVRPAIVYGIGDRNGLSKYETTCTSLIHGFILLIKVL